MSLLIAKIVSLIRRLMAISTVRLWLIPAPLIEELEQSVSAATPATLSHQANITQAGSETLNVSEPAFIKLRD
jgi:hypothetical protein